MENNFGGMNHIILVDGDSTFKQGNFKMLDGIDFNPTSSTMISFFYDGTFYYQL